MAQTQYADTTIFKGHTSGNGTGEVKKQFSAVTTDNTATVVYAHPVAELGAVNMTVRTLGLRSDATEAIRSTVNSGFRRAAAGNVTEIGSDTAIASAEDSSGTPTVTLVANTSNQTVDVTVTGESAKTFYWEIAVTYVAKQL
jgi:hypothetical protein